jgi:hypothetical protein
MGLSRESPLKSGEHHVREGPPLPVALLVGILVVFTISVALLTSQSHESRRGLDDAYITYRYAENLAHGRGFVFNPGDAPALGTSAPLYAGLLALGGLLGMDIPFMSLALGILGCSLAFAIIACIAWEFRALSAGLIVGITASVGQIYWWWEGMETPLYVVLVLGALWTAYRGWNLLAFLLAALATVMRLDGLAVLVAIALFVFSERRWSWRAIAPGALILSSWVIVATVLFGSPMPASGLAKMAHDVGISGRFSVTSLSLLQQTLPITTLVSDFTFLNHPRRTTALFCFLFMAPLACTVLLRPRRLGGLLTCWLVFYIAGYELLGLPDFTWYYAPPAIVLALFLWMALRGALAFGVNAIYGRGEMLADCLTWMVTIFTLVMLVTETPLYSKVQPEREDTHLLAGKWLRQHAAAGDTLVAYEVGKVAYVSGLRTTDLLGLTDPLARVHLRGDDFAWAIRDLPTYVFSGESPTWPVTAAIFKECAFALNYRVALRLPFRDSGDYVIFRRAHLAEVEPSGSPWGAEWLDIHHPTSMRSGSATADSVSVRNLSTFFWRAHTTDAPFLTYDWRDEHGRRIASEVSRTPLPCDVGPGQWVLLNASVRSPTQPGTYSLSWQLIREGSGYFSEHGMATATAPVVVY